MQNKDYLTELMESANKNTQQNIKTLYLAEIVKLEPPTCSVQPLAMINGKKLPMVEDVHFITYPVQYRFSADFNNPIQYVDTVGKYEEPVHRTLEIKHQNQKVINKKLNYKQGDIVLVDILDLDDAFFQGKGKFNVGSVRRHSMDYSIVVGKIANKKDFKYKKKN